MRSDPLVTITLRHEEPKVARNSQLNRIAIGLREQFPTHINSSIHAVKLPGPSGVFELMPEPAVNLNEPMTNWWIIANSLVPADSIPPTHAAFGIRSRDRVAQK